MGQHLQFFRITALWHQLRKLGYVSYEVAGIRDDFVYNVQEWCWYWPIADAVRICYRAVIPSLRQRRERIHGPIAWSRKFWQHAVDLQSFAIVLIERRDAIPTKLSIFTLIRLETMTNQSHTVEMVTLITNVRLLRQRQMMKSRGSRSSPVEQHQSLLQITHKDRLCYFFVLLDGFFSYCLEICCLRSRC